MIHINNRDISDIYRASRAIVEVYKGHRLVWQKIKEIISCYSNGYWVDEYPWVDDTFWKDNQD